MRIQTLAFGCTSTPRSYQNILEESEQLEKHSLIEEAIGAELLRHLASVTKLRSATDSLEYISISSDIRVYTSDLSKDHQLREGLPRDVKHLFTLRPEVAFKSVCKEELMAKYHEDGYYFLEEYIEGLLEQSYLNLLPY